MEEAGRRRGAGAVAISRGGLPHLATFSGLFLYLGERGTKGGRGFWLETGGGRGLKSHSRWSRVILQGEGLGGV